MRKESKKGISLIETMVVISLVAIMSFAFSIIFINALKVYRQEESETEIISDTQTNLDRITTDINGANSVSATNSGYAADAHTLILKTPSVDTGQNFVYSGGNLAYDYIIYYLSGTSLHRKTVSDANSFRGNSDVTIGKNVYSITYTYDPNIAIANKITTQIIASRQIGKVSRSITLTAKAKMRNQ